jgi:hypothetical protein
MSKANYSLRLQPSLKAAAERMASAVPRGMPPVELLVCGA